MNFKNIGIKCPSCGNIEIYEKDQLSEHYKSKDGCRLNWDDELFTLCGNKNCKLEFLVDTGLGKEEKQFVENVLAPFHNKWWYIDRFIAGGSLTDRSVIGADFLIHNLSGGVVWVEYKRHNKFSFTEAQYLRFINSIDNNAVATRFIGLITVQKKGYEDYNNQIHYWTPAFFRIIPNESFTLEKTKSEIKFRPKKSLNLTGLDQCIQKNVYTIERKPNRNLFPISNVEKEAILQNPNVSIFNLIAGSLFRKGEYEKISNEAAFKIIALKLRQTVNNRAEDILWQQRSPYITHNITKITREEIRPILKPKIIEIVWNSYRPLFPIEITKIMEQIPELKTYIIRDDKEIAYIVENKKYSPLRTIIKLTMEIIFREGRFSRTRAEADSIYQYFTKGHLIIPLKIPTSIYLDFLKKYIEICLKQFEQENGMNISEIKNSSEYKHVITSFFPISNPKLAEFIQMDYNSVRGKFERPYRDELIKKGLVNIEKRGTVYKKGRRPEVMAEYIWEVNLTDRGIEYIMKLGAFSR